MKTEVPIEHLLRWRLARAEAEAPAAPRAARLLAVPRPWWELLPEQFAQLVHRLRAIQVQFGHAMADPGQSQPGYRVAALITGAGEDLETAARILYLSVQGTRLRLRFELEQRPAADMPGAVEVAFVAEQAGQPLFSAGATLSLEKEYRLEAELPPELARSWQRLKVTDRMPFRFLIRAGKSK
jgi:hypothetical protein